MHVGQYNTLNTEWKSPETAFESFKGTMKSSVSERITTKKKSLLDSWITSSRSRASAFVIWSIYIKVV